MTQLDSAFWAIVGDLDTEFEADTQDPERPTRGIRRCVGALSVALAALACMAPCSTMARAVATSPDQLPPAARAGSL